MSTTESSTEEKGEDPPVPTCKIISTSTPETRCLLCNTGIIDPVTLGDLYEIDNVQSHYYCLLLSCNLWCSGADHEGIQGFLSKDILKEVKRGSRLKCSYCKQKGATIGCSLKSCRKMFHLPCGQKMGSMHQFFNSFLSFCPSHRPQQKVSSKCIKLLKEDEDSKTCPICYESVGNTVSNETLWAPCCRKRWFHRICLQRQALAQGYFFKCPMCNNKDKFNSEMKQFGIYIPEMDAAWEREPQAFQDLLHTHKTCDARNCQCPDGRSFTQNTGSWRLIRCNSCGSQGTHIVCSGLKMTASSNSWRCSSCARIFNKEKETVRQDSFETRSSGLSTSPSISPPLSPSLAPFLTPSLSPCPSPAPSTSSRSFSISSSQRRSAVDVSIEQDRKRRKSSPNSTNLGVINKSSYTHKKDTNNTEQAKQQDTLPGPSCQCDTDDDEIVVVDDSESDVEVVDIETNTSPLRTYPVSSELLTNDGKTIKVHKVSAEGHTTPLEIGSLGAVNMRPASVKQVARPGLSQSKNISPESISRKTEIPDTASHPSTSKDSTQLHVQNVCSISEPLSKFVNDPSSQMNGSTLGIQIGDVRHSNELFSATRKEDDAVNAQESSVQISTHAGLLDFVNKLRFPVQSIYLLPVQTVDGRTAVQPYIPVNALSPSQHQQLIQAQQQRRMAAAKATALPDPDVVTLD